MFPDEWDEFEYHELDSHSLDGTGTGLSYMTVAAKYNSASGYCVLYPTTH